ncbi:MAG: TonB-dependent receptor [Bacteroidales bacterium]|nr:MAG: TonB-dependent receptor [Bacteroidales bacterium]
MPPRPSATGVRSSLPAGEYGMAVEYIGYDTRRQRVAVAAGGDMSLTVRLRESAVAIRDVVVTASESRGVTGASTIDRKAMEHLQPSSFADLLSLLPAGSASAPVLGVPNTIRLREVGVSSSDYASSSLGTSFVIDGAPVSTDANMQYIAGSSLYDPIVNYSYFVNAGVDMRTIATDEIESVEIVRGIPSVQYGDLTSGLVKIRRRRGGNDLDARFKADMSSKLFYAGKGFELPERGLTLNAGIDFLDARTDPRNSLENYKRLTASLRGGKRWDGAAGTATLGVNLDYTGSFDNRKEDPDLNNGNTDEFRSQYNRMALNVGFDYEAAAGGFFRSFEATAAFDYSADRIDRRRFVSISKPMAAPVNTEAGEFDAVPLDASYTAEMTVEGRPMSAYVKAAATFAAATDNSRNTFIAGGDWSMDKNFGRGQVVDLAHPLFSGLASRPRPYCDIPAQHDLALFAEANSSVAMGRMHLDAMAGVRAATMLNLSRGYSMRGRVWLDPRLNVRLSLPAAAIGGERIETAVAGGVGWHTKSPTMDQLYPAPVYYDFTQLSYFHNDPALRRVNVRTYVVDPTNFGLQPARNFKWEVRGEIAVAGNRLSVTYFEEDMSSGFRSAAMYDTYTYKTYDYSGVDASQLTGPPSLDDMPYEVDTVLRSRAVTTNGSRTRKRGVEFTFSSQRIEALRTRLTVTGAWFRSEYGNSEPIYYHPSTMIGGREIPYVGIYDDDSRYIREACNTNFMVDTDIPRLGLGFSLTFQCQWYTRELNTHRSSRPTSYVDLDGAVHPYTDASAEDTYLKWLIVEYNEASFRWHGVPFAMTTNLKVTKRLWGERVRAAMFVTQMLNYTPDYDVDGVTVRRSVTPYFGMELNFKL